MKGTKLMTAMLLLSVAFVCFISAPVMSVEDPWDVDGGSDGGGGGFGGAGDDQDTIVDPDGILQRTNPGGEPDGGGDWLWYFGTDLFFGIVSGVYATHTAETVDAGMTSQAGR